VYLRYAALNGTDAVVRWAFLYDDVKTVV